MSATLLSCRLCGQQKQLIKAHIIPKQFYRRIMGGTPNLLKFEVDNVVNQTTTQNGIHQNDLLCAECDNQIGKYDKYAYKVLPLKIDQKKLISPFGHGLHIYEIGEIRVEIFRMSSFISLEGWHCS